MASQSQQPRGRGRPLGTEACEANPTIAALVASEEGIPLTNEFGMVGYRNINISSAHYAATNNKSTLPHDCPKTVPPKKREI